MQDRRFLPETQTSSCVEVCIIGRIVVTLSQALGVTVGRTKPRRVRQQPQPQ
jgi:hypothetical protein